MVSLKESVARIKTFFRFGQDELLGLILAIIVTAFIFSFRDWGKEQFSFNLGLLHFVVMILVASLSFFFRFSCQKMYALSEGYLAKFKVWWVGLAIALVLVFLTNGRLPLVLIGGVSISFLVKQRLGEFRYGFSHEDNAMISLWGIFGNLILAIIFAIFHFFLPETYFFSKGLLLNLIMAFCALFPFPQLNGLDLFFGSRGLYYLGLSFVLLGLVLLLTETKIGLILAIIITSTAGILYILKRSEK